MNFLSLKFYFNGLICSSLIMLFFTTPALTQNLDEILDGFVEEYDPENYLTNWTLQLTLGNDLILSDAHKVYIQENLAAIRSRKIEFTKERKKAEALQADDLVMDYQTKWELLHSLAQRYFDVLETTLDEY